MSFEGKEIEKVLMLYINAYVKPTITRELEATQEKLASKKKGVRFKNKNVPLQKTEALKNLKWINAGIINLTGELDFSILEEYNKFLKKIYHFYAFNLIIQEENKISNKSQKILNEICELSSNLARLYKKYMAENNVVDSGKLTGLGFLFAKSVECFKPSNFKSLYFFIAEAKHINLTLRMLLEKKKAEFCHDTLSYCYQQGCVLTEMLPQCAAGDWLEISHVHLFESSLMWVMVFVSRPNKDLIYIRNLFKGMAETMKDAVKGGDYNTDMINLSQLYIIFYMLKKTTRNQNFATLIINKFNAIKRYLAKNYVDSGEEILKEITGYYRTIIEGIKIILEQLCFCYSRRSKQACSNIKEMLSREAHRSEAEIFNANHELWLAHKILLLIGNKSGGIRFGGSLYGSISKSVEKALKAMENRDFILAKKPRKKTKRKKAIVSEQFKLQLLESEKETTFRKTTSYYMSKKPKSSRPNFFEFKKKKTIGVPFKNTHDLTTPRNILYGKYVVLISDVNRLDLNSYVEELISDARRRIDDGNEFIVIDVGAGCVFIDLCGLKEKSLYKFNNPDVYVVGDVRLDIKHEHVRTIPEDLYNYKTCRREIKKYPVISDCCSAKVKMFFAFFLQDRRYKPFKILFKFFANEERRFGYITPKHNNWAFYQVFAEGSKGGVSLVGRGGCDFKFTGCPNYPVKLRIKDRDFGNSRLHGKKTEDDIFDDNQTVYNFSKLVRKAHR